MKPAMKKFFCCSIFAASGVVAVYVLISYTIAFAYELLWIMESETGLPAAAYLLAICYFGVMTATVVLIHGLATNHLKCILGWLIAIILILIPECCFVFYMSISHWGLQSLYGMTELIFYLIRLLALVVGIVIIQSYYATKLMEGQIMKHAINGNSTIVNNLQPSLTESEFNASSFVPGSDVVDAPSLYAYTNFGMIRDQNKFARSMPDLREEFIQKVPAEFPVQMSKYWQPPPEDVVQSKRYIQNLPPNYVFPHYTRSLDRRCRKNMAKRSGSLVELQQLPELNNRNMYSSYGNNLLAPTRNMEEIKPDPFNLAMPRDFVFYGPTMFGPDGLAYRRQYMDSKYGSSKTSMGNESDDLTKYRDVAL